MKRFLPELFLGFLVFYFSYISYNFGTLDPLSHDTQAYKDYFHHLEGLDLKGVINFHRDIGYSLITAFMAKIGVSFSIYYTLFCVMTSLFFWLPFLRLKRHLTQISYFTLSLAPFTTLFHPFNLSHFMRQNFAQAVAFNVFFLKPGILSSCLSLLATSFHFSVGYFILLFIGIRLLPLGFNQEILSDRWKYLAQLAVMLVYMGTIKLSRIVSFEYFLGAAPEIYFEWSVVIFWAFAFLLFVLHQLLRPEGFILKPHERFSALMIFTVWLIIKVYYMDAYSVSIRWGHFAIMIMPLYLMANLKRDIPYAVIVIALSLTWLFTT